MRKCIHINRLDCDMNSVIYWNNIRYSIIKIDVVPRRFRSKFPEDTYAYCTLKKYYSLFK